MRIKILNEILIIDILSILLVVLTTIISSSPARVILGLPFIILFPGYTLFAALFTKTTMGGLEQLAISIGMSIAVVGLICFGLNYTTWGIRLEPIVYSISAFIIITSLIALSRRIRADGIGGLISDVNFQFPGWNGSLVNKLLSVILAIVMLGTLAVLAYTLAVPRIGEQFTEFYILGKNGKARYYPTQYVMSKGIVTQIIYGDGTMDTTTGLGVISLGITNQEQLNYTYFVKVTINNEPVDITLNGTAYEQLGPIELQQGGKWEKDIGIAPQHTGDNQKVEFQLYRGNENTPYKLLHYWITVKEK